MKIVFFGTPEFSATILEALIISGYAPVLVVTAGDKPVGRNKTITPPPVKALALKHQIKVLQPQDLENIELDLKTLNPDLIVVAAYGPPFLTQNI
ncbi:MAG: formyltransferase family protein, partial [Nanoarchaeota archaeon]|nr:formyltransferase family protein [Nanoarchaeota archaeon]